MNDRLFFALAFGVTLAMVGSSMVIGSRRPQCGPVGGADGPADYSTATISGRDLCRMVAGGEAQLDLRDDSVLKITAIVGALGDNPQGNPHFTLAADLEVAYSGQNLTVTVTARSRDEGGAFEANYSTGNAGNSGWRRFDLTPEWQAYTFEYRVPERLLQDAVAYDYLAIRPVVPFGSRSVEIKAVELRRNGLWAKG